MPRRRQEFCNSISFNSPHYRMRLFGQAKLPPSFISKSSFVNQDPQPKPSKKPIPLSEFLDRKLAKTSGRLLQEKRISIGSIGSDKKELGGKNNEDGSSSMTTQDAILKRFSRALKGKDNFDLSDGAETEQQFSRKRKKLTELPPGDTANHQNRLLVLGDDPKPKLRKTEQKPTHQSAKTIYNHYASGQGWWDGDKEGIDSEEVGCSEVWEGVGSATLGGMEWH